MYPTKGDLHFAPFSDLALYIEQVNKSNFWYQQSFHGVDLACLRDAAVKEYFKQPIVDTFDISICMAKSQCYSVDFLTAEEADLHTIEIPFDFAITQNGEVHGLAFWFDVAFLGSDKPVWLSTSPTEPLSHWYQVLALIEKPVLVFKDQSLTGRVRLVSNKRQSYDVEIEVRHPGTGQLSTNVLDLVSFLALLSLPSLSIDLQSKMMLLNLLLTTKSFQPFQKNPCFHYTGQPVKPAAGTYEQSPSQQLWTTLDTTTVTQQPQPLIQPQAQLVSINALSNNVMNCLVNGNGTATIQQQELETAPLTMQPTQHLTFVANNNNGNGVESSGTLMNSNGLVGSVINANGVINSNNVLHPNNVLNTNGLAGAQTNNKPHQNGYFNQLNSVYNTSSFPVNNSLMIGDYVANNLVLPTQNNFK